MRRRCSRLLLVCALAFGTMAGPALAVHDGNPDATGMTQLFNSPNSSVPQAINSDLAFWGNRAYAGNYDGFRIFDVSKPAAPVLLSDFKCHGPQNDAVIWQNRLLFTAVDRTQTKPECGSVDTTHPDGTAFHDDPDGWEGVRIFDVSNPRAPQQIGSVYTDCGAHTITLWPKNRSQLLLYVSSYPLRPGPTCGPTRGPEHGNSPLHEKISVIRVPTRHPERARVIAQPRIRYPGDADNKFTPSEHGLHGFNDLTACHDIGVFVELRLAAAACAEQAQLWRVKSNGIPDTEHPIWVFDDQVDETGTTGNPADPGVVVDFWHSATFSWDGKVVNFIDESFGHGCPTTTPAPGETATQSGDTGRMFFLDTASGRKLSHFQIPRPETPEPGPTYCSAHLGNAVHTADANLLVNAWYTGGADVVDFNNPAHPFESTFFDAGNGATAGSDNWYEGPGLGRSSLTMYGTDGVEDPPSGLGFQVFKALTDIKDIPLPFLNPQTQMNVLDRNDEGDDDDQGDHSGQGGGGDGRAARRGNAGAPRTELGRPVAPPAARHLAP